MNDERVVHLYISSWIGTSLGATHFYGELQGEIDSEYKKVELMDTLTSAQAVRLRKSGYNYLDAGDLYSGFDTRDDVIKMGVEQFRQHFPAADILVLGRSAVADPQKILVGPADLIAFVNPLADEAKRIGGYEGDERRMEAIFRKFQKFWSSYK
jgi:hypothetical protein